MPLSEEYQYLYKYYCKKYGEQRAHKILAKKPEKFLSRANDICKWKKSFDEGIFYELKKLDDSSIHSKHRPKTMLADKSQTKLGSSFGLGIFWGIYLSGLFTLAWFIICYIFDIHYNFKYLSTIAPFLLGATLLASAFIEIYSVIARISFNIRQKEFPYACLYIQHCAQNVEVKEIVNIPKLDLELINIYYEAISHALKERITTHKEQLYNTLNEFCQSANYHNVVCKSIPTYNYYGTRLSNNKKLMPFSEIREHFDDPKGFKVLMALLNPNHNEQSSSNCKCDDRYFDSAFFDVKLRKNYKTHKEILITITTIFTIFLSFFLFKFPFVWHQQKQIAGDKLYQDSLIRYKQACNLIDLNYKKKFQQPAYLIGVSVKHKMLRNGGIGNDWNTYAEANGRQLKRSEITIPIVVGESLTLSSKITEIDPSSDDVGSDYEDVPLTLEQIEDGTSIVLNVNVREHHGPGSGESADWESIFRIRKINKLKHLPKNYKPVKEPYPPKPSEEIKQEVKSKDVFMLTIKNII